MEATRTRKTTKLQLAEALADMEYGPTVGVNSVQYWVNAHMRNRSKDDLVALAWRVLDAATDSERAARNPHWTPEAVARLLTAVEGL